MRRLSRDRKDRKVIHRRGHSGWAGQQQLLLELERTRPTRRAGLMYPTVRDAMNGTNALTADTRRGMGGLPIGSNGARP